MEPSRTSDPPYALVPQLEARMAVTELEHERADRSLVLVRDRIEACIHRLRKRPSINGDEVTRRRKNDETNDTGLSQ